MVEILKPVEISMVEILKSIDQYGRDTEINRSVRSIVEILKCAQFETSIINILDDYTLQVIHWTNTVM